MLHKTDGSHTNRPFFRSMQDTRESVFSQINQLSRSVFCFFSSRKEIVPLKKKRSKRKSTAAELLFCSSAAFANVQHKTDGSNANRPFFSFHVGHAGKRLFSDKSTVPLCLLFLFFKKRNRSLSFLSRKKRNRSLSEEKNRPSITSTARRGSRRQPSCPRPLRGSRSQRRSQRLRPHTRTACSSCRSPHRQ